MLKTIFTLALLLSASSSQFLPHPSLFIDKVISCVDADGSTTGILASPTKRGLGCPPGIPCGPGPECTIDDCGLAGCEDAPVCTKRGLGCPPGIPCGPGPECTVNDCEIEGCKTAPVCTKRSAEPIIHPCTEICDAQGVCICETKVKREATPVVHPCPEICNEQGICGCALESETAKL